MHADGHEFPADSGVDIRIIELFRHRFPVSFGYIEFDHGENISSIY